MILWRISNHLSLTGSGVPRASGRWHTRGRRIVYCAQTPAAALLEVLVHFELEVRGLPVRYRLLRVQAPDDVEAEQVSRDTLPADRVDNTDLTRATGDAWLARNRSPLLLIPSAVVPEAYNILLNPAHPDAGRIVIAHVSDHAIDPRLLR